MSTIKQTLDQNLRFERMLADESSWDLRKVRADPPVVRYNTHYVYPVGKTPQEFFGKPGVEVKVEGKWIVLTLQDRNLWNYAEYFHAYMPTFYTKLVLELLETHLTKKSNWSVNSDGVYKCHWGVGYGFFVYGPLWKYNYGIREILAKPEIGFLFGGFELHAEEFGHRYFITGLTFSPLCSSCVIS